MNATFVVGVFAKPQKASECLISSIILVIKILPLLLLHVFTF